jgi:hypothetical protein
LSSHCHLLRGHRVELAGCFRCLRRIVPASQQPKHFRYAKFVRPEHDKEHSTVQHFNVVQISLFSCNTSANTLNSIFQVNLNSAKLRSGTKCLAEVEFNSENNENELCFSICSLFC